MTQSKIVDQHGQPFKKETLSKEVAAPSLTGVRTVWNNGSVASGLTPSRLASILTAASENDANAYLTLAEEIEERDLHYSSVLGTRKRAISGLPVVVEAASDNNKDQELADAVRNLVRRPEFSDAVDDLLDGLGKGYSVVEMNWDTTRVPWEPINRTQVQDGELKTTEGYIWRQPQFFKFDHINGRQLRLIDEENSFNGIPLQPYKFICHIPKLKTGLPIRGGLARLVAVAYMCKAYTVTDWLAFAEVFGMPLRVGKYGRGATENDIRTLINAVANIGSDAAAVIPDSMRIDFEAASNSSGGDELFLKLAEWLDRQVSKAVLGQTASSEGTPGKLGNDDAQDDVRQDILKADAKQLSNTINRDLVRPFIDLNYGEQESYPRIIFQVNNPEDTEALTNALEKLVRLGLKVEASVIRDKLGLPDPEENAELLGPPATEPANNHQNNSTALNRENNQKPDYLDELEQEALQDWQAQIQPTRLALEQLADQSESFDDFVTGLADLSDKIDNTELVNQLARQAFKARGIGDTTD